MIWLCFIAYQHMRVIEYEIQLYIYIYIYIYVCVCVCVYKQGKTRHKFDVKMYKVEKIQILQKVATLVEGDPKAPF